MTGKTVHYVLFSPTGTTRATIRAVGYGTGRELGQTVDITLGDPPEPIQFAQDDLVLVGMPVYGNRLPCLAVERFRTIGGEGTPVVAIVVYGNRAYGDALVELCDLCVAQGFNTVAAGAFLGEHSYSTNALPIAPGRPDQEDILLGEEFGARIEKLLEGCESAARLDLGDLPGNRPYKPAMQLAGVAADTDPEACTRCGKCIECCPTQGTRMAEPVPVTEEDNCIWCLACVRNCPANARRVSLPRINDMSQWLHNACKERREPECFLAT